MIVDRYIVLNQVKRDKMGADITGWEPEKRTHFDEIVLNYDKIRPEYPCKLFAYVIDFAGSGKKKALEIGAGTGKATAHFLEAGYDVTAVEIGANMAEFLKGRFGKCDKFKVINNSFENAPLNEDSYDLIYAASAFHWVDAVIGVPKAWQLLKNSGTFALFRFNEIPSEHEELFRAIREAYKKYCHKTYKIPAKMPPEISVEEKISIFRGFGFNDLREYGFMDVLMKLYAVSRTFSADEYLLFLDTLADHRNLPKDDRTALYTGIKEAILRHGGSYKVNYIFQLYMGRK